PAVVVGKAGGCRRGRYGGSVRFGGGGGSGAGGDSGCRAQPPGTTGERTNAEPRTASVRGRDRGERPVGRLTLAAHLPHRAAARSARSCITLTPPTVFPISAAVSRSE